MNAVTRVTFQWYEPIEPPAPAASMGTEARIAAAIERLRTIDDQCLSLIAERIRCTVVRTDHQDESIAILCRVQDELHAAASDAIKLLEGGKP